MLWEQEHEYDLARCLVWSAALFFAGLAAGTEKTIVRFRLMDTAAGQTTPAMVCVAGASDGEARNRRR